MGEKITSWESLRMSISNSKFPGLMRSVKLNFGDGLNFGLESENFRKFKTFWRELRTRPTFDCCVCLPSLTITGERHCVTTQTPHPQGYLCAQNGGGTWLCGTLWVIEVEQSSLILGSLSLPLPLPSCYCIYIGTRNRVWAQGGVFCSVLNFCQRATVKPRLRGPTRVFVYKQGKLGQMEISFPVRLS